MLRCPPHLATSSPVPGRYAAVRALIVEDHPFQRIAAETVLRQLGVEQIMAAENGAQAADILAREAVDLVLCDIDMPDGNGPELIAGLHRRGKQAFARTPPDWAWVSALASDILESNRMLAHEAGITHVHTLHKPLSTDAVDQILAHMRARQTSVASATPKWMPSDAQLLAATQSGADWTVMLQPQHDLATGRLAGAEALVRWRHPRHGLIPPDSFIPRLEALGAADPVFFFVAQQCLAAQRQLRDAGIAISIGVNASAQTLSRPGMVERLDGLVAAAGLPRSTLTIELTEGYAANDPLELSVTMNRLRLKGYGIAIDDFGVGNATPKLLADLPFTQLKLDRSFVSEVCGDDQRGAICRHMVALAGHLGMECVAEGVETEAQRAALQALHCTLGQGYLWSPPKPMHTFVSDAVEHASL